MALRWSYRIRSANTTRSKTKIKNLKTLIMKRLSIIAVFALTLISTAFDNKTTAPDFKGIKSFNKSFPEATEVVYKAVEKFTEVSFTWHNMQLQAFYDSDGNLFATTRHIDIKDLPLSYLMNIRREFAGFVPTEAI